jgi:hypothetical protein
MLARLRQARRLALIDGPAEPRGTTAAPSVAVQERKTPAWGEAGVDRRMGEGLGAGGTPPGALAQSNALQAVLFRSPARLFRSCLDRSVPSFTP